MRINIYIKRNESSGLSFQFMNFQIRRGTSTRILKQTLARDRTEEMG